MGWRLFHVDAFTAVPFAGNPAAVLVMDTEPAGELGARLGAELNLPATAVVWPLGEPGLFGLRWFTPVRELELCGHGTLSAARVLADAGLAPGGRLTFRTSAGELGADVDSAKIRLRFPALAPVPLADPALAAAVREVAGPGVTELLRSDLDAVAVLGSAAEVRAARPDLTALARLPLRGLIVTAAGDGPDADFVSRFFAPSVGNDEDHVTGSAHCALAPYWIGRIGRQPLTGYQASARGGFIEVELADGGVTLTGTAVVLSDGAWHATL